MLAPSLTCATGTLTRRRRASHQVIDFQILTEDYSKLVFACADRSLVFHARFGGHFSARLPKMPRSVAYHAPSADVFAVGSASEVYRLNLELGRFMSPLPSSSPGLNVARVCPAHGLLAAGGDDAALECFDVRQAVAATRMEDVTAGGGGVTCLRFDNSGTMVRRRRLTFVIWCSAADIRISPADGGRLAGGKGAAV